MNEEPERRIEPKDYDGSTGGPKAANPFRTKGGMRYYMMGSDSPATLRVYDPGDDDPASEDFRVALGFEVLAWGRSIVELTRGEVAALHADLGAWLAAASPPPTAAEFQRLQKKVTRLWQTTNGLAEALLKTQTQTLETTKALLAAVELLAQGSAA